MSLGPRAWAQARRTFEGSRRRGDRSPAQSRGGIPFELRGDLLVAADRGHRAVPEPALVIRDDFGQGNVHLEHFPRVGSLTNGRADEWVAEADLGFADVDQARLHRGLNRRQRRMGSRKDLTKRRSTVECRGEQDEACLRR